MNICLECGCELIGKYTKKFCSKSCSAINFNRKRIESGWMMSEESRAKTSQTLTGRVGHTKNKGKLLVERVEKVCNECGSVFKDTPSSNKKYCSTTCGKNNIGGYREGSGKSKFGYYKGIFCGSTYELAWVIYRLDHGLHVERFNGHIVYDGNKKYFPDFVEGNHIYEMKGWTTKTTDKTLLQKIDGAEKSGYTIDVLFKEDLAVEFEWCKNNYSYKKLYELYDDYKPKYEYSCSHCGIMFLRDKEAKSEIVFCSRRCAGLGHRGRNILGINAHKQ